jgi:hypothetical protein
MKRTAIQKQVSVTVGNLIRQVDSIGDLEENVKGRLVESFNEEILKSFLTSQFDIGNGVIINHLGEQSGETDIIIYDKRLLPPFIKQERSAVYPIESVIATIEVKCSLNMKKLKKVEASAKLLQETVFDRKQSLLKNAKYSGMCQPPLSAVLAFRSIKEVSKLSSPKEGELWIKGNIKHLFAICIVNEFSWLNVSTKGWSIVERDDANEETKRFIAVFLDNVRTRGEQRYMLNSTEHNDWLSAYIKK